MKKILLIAGAAIALGACTGSYHQGNCDFDYLIHPQISITRLVGCS